MITSPTAAIRLRPTAIVLTMLVAVLGLVLGCGGSAGSPAGGGGSGGPAATPSAPDTIVIKNFTFMPASLTVAPGTKITVINQDQAPHTVTADDKSFDSRTISGGQRGEITAPTKPGSYPYICTIHQYMKGTLIVQ
ncbi:MAG TPA: cupredoxin family copper-binding protein [Pseudonocardiaceae bacterium]|nr:cupredoxin family copper-binding protein [Pseudonocardiaceae bacterium]